MPMLAELVDGVIGVDTHRDTLAAAAVTSLGGVLAQSTNSPHAPGFSLLVGLAAPPPRRPRPPPPARLRPPLPARPALLGGRRGGQLRRRPDRVHAAARRAGR